MPWHVENFFYVCKRRLKADLLQMYSVSSSFARFGQHFPLHIFFAWKRFHEYQSAGLCCFWSHPNSMFHRYKHFLADDVAKTPHFYDVSQMKVFFVVAGDVAKGHPVLTSMCHRCKVFCWCSKRQVAGDGVAIFPAPSPLLSSGNESSIPHCYMM